MIKKSKILILFIILLQSANAFGQISIARLKYNGGGDWYANKTSLPNLITFCNHNLRTNFNEQEALVEVGSPEIFNYPIIHMTGHGNVLFTEAEAKNLRQYLISGGFLHIDDNYGMESYVRREFKKVFPETEFVELPFDHPIYHQKYIFEQGPPKVHEHDGKPAQGFGIFYQGRLVIYFTYEADLGNGWEDQEVYNDPEPVRQRALQMGANIVTYVFARQNNP